MKSNVPKITRYRTGKLPNWINEDNKIDNNNDTINSIKEKEKERENKDADKIYNESKRDHCKIESISEQKSSKSESRKIYQAEIIKSTLKPSENITNAIILPNINDLAVPQALDISEEDQDADERRARIRQRVAQREAEELVAAKVIPDIVAPKVNESESEEESEYESESEEEYAAKPMFKPIFISAAQRVQSSAQLEEEAALAEAEKQRLKERKKESRSIVVDELRKEEEAKVVQEIEMPDDTDDLESEEAINAWKERERSRILRDKAVLEDELKEKKEIERRRDMSDLEIIRENRRLGIGQKDKEKNPDVKFMQKYYHKGAFYQDDEKIKETIAKHDLLQPTGFDKEVDMSLMPKVMQVKEFGMADTHLVDQDTSNHEVNPWISAEKEFGIKKYPLKKTGYK